MHRPAPSPVLIAFATTALVLLASGAASLIAQDAAAAAPAGNAAGNAAEKHHVRVIALKGLYVEHSTGDSFDPMSLLLGGGGPTRGFPELSERLVEIAADPAIDTVLFDLSAPFSMNVPQIAELRRRIAGLREAGKKTVVWAESASLPHLAVASACERTLMADFGAVDFPSLGMTAMHFKDAMDSIGVEASVARAGDFKGAVEPFTLSEISDHLKEHYREMLRSMNDDVVRWVSEGRGLTTSEVRSLQADRIFTSRDALERKLVDNLVPYGQMKEFIESEHPEGVEWVLPGKKTQAPPNFFELFGELFGVKPEKRTDEPSIAVLHMGGEIVDGVTAVPGSIVSGPMVKEIEKLAADANIKGVVLRIDSPGGSATASEAVRQALVELSAKKPVVVSMASLAASGGYWITCIGRPIYAEAGTITGSIGVFAMKLSVGGLLGSVGVRVTPITLDESAGAMDMARGWTPQELARIETLIGDVYDRFLGLVSESRKLPREKVDAIGGGRVWSGLQALDLGLVDGIGGTSQAIAHVAREAGLPEDAPVVHRPGAVNPFASLELFGGGGDEIRGIHSGAAIRLLAEAGFDLRPHLRRALASLREPGPKVLLLAPTTIRIR